MFRPELVLSLLKPIYGRVELLQVCLILAHQVFGLLLHFIRQLFRTIRLGTSAHKRKEPDRSGPFPFRL
jgi:hypothetical protein